MKTQNLKQASKAGDSLKRASPRKNNKRIDKISKFKKKVRPPKKKREKYRTRIPNAASKRGANSRASRSKEKSGWRTQSY